MLEAIAIDVPIAIVLTRFIKADTEFIEDKHTGKYISNLTFDVSFYYVLYTIRYLVQIQMMSGEEKDYQRKQRELKEKREHDLKMAKVTGKDPDSESDYF